MKKFTLLFCAAFIITLAHAQKDLTIEETVLNRAALMPSTLTQLQWIANTNSFSWVRQNEDAVDELVSSSGDGKKVKVLLTLTDLNAQLVKANLTALGPQPKFPVITWINANQFTFETGDYTVTYDLKGKSFTTKPVQLFPSGAENHDKSSAGITAFTLQNNLYIMKDGQQSTVTNDLDQGIVNGKSVHRDEFGIHKGTFWSPNGKILAYYRMDETMVTEYPIMEIGALPAKARMIRYPMAGGKSHHVTLGVYNTETGKTIFLNTGEPKEQYLTNIAWSPDNKWIYIAVVNRDQNHLWLNRYNAETGAFDKTLFEETDEQWVQPMYTLMFVPGHDDQFVWQSERDGFNALYLYNTNGTLVRQLTPSASTGTINIGLGTGAMKSLVVTELYGIDATGKNAYFQCAPDGTCDRVICSVDLGVGVSSVKWLSNASGYNTAKFSKDYSQLICEFSDPQTPRVISVRKNDGKISGTLHTAPNPVAAYNKCVMKLFTITAADGKTPIWCRMFLPAGFDSTKKYPSLTYVYNGPNAQMVYNTWMGGSDLFLYYMAQKGFVVFTVDGRGSDNRGSEFEQVIHQHLGKAEMADQAKGADYLKSKSWIDASRMAVYGWSYGGFMATSMMTRTNGTYKCGVAGGAVVDWAMYEVMYTERYMDTPEQNPEGYKESNTRNYVKDLKGKLLMIHGTSDDVVVWQHTLAYTKAAVDKGVQTDYYMYPGHLHNVRGKDRVHLLTKIADYVITNT